MKLRIKRFKTTLDMVEYINEFKLDLVNFVINEDKKIEAVFKDHRI